MAPELNREKMQEQHNILWETVFGNPVTKDPGMKEKLDEIHQILVQAKGIKGLFGTIILLGATLAVIKMWLIGK